MAKEKEYQQAWKWACWMRESLQMMSSIYLGDFPGAKPGVEFHNDDSQYFDPRRYEIHLGTKGIVDLFHPTTREEFVEAVNFVYGHEEQHLRSTTDKEYEWGIKRGIEVILEYIASKIEPRRKVFRSDEDYTAYAEELKQKGIYLNYSMLVKYVSGQINALEDGRIERIRPKKFPGYKALRKKFRFLFWNTPAENYPTEEELEKNPANRLRILQNNILSLATTQLYKKGFKDAYEGTEFKAELDSLMPFIQRAIAAPSCRDMAKENVAICEQMAPLFFEVCQMSAKDIAAKKMLEEMIRDMIISNHKNGRKENEEKGAPGAIDSLFNHSDLEVTLPDEVYDDLVKNAKEEGDGDGGITIKREHPLPPEENEAEEDATEDSSNESSATGENSFNGSETSSSSESSASSEGSEGSSSEGSEGSEESSSEGSSENTSGTDSSKSSEETSGNGTSGEETSEGTSSSSEDGSASESSNGAEENGASLKNGEENSESASGGTSQSEEASQSDETSQNEGTSSSTSSTENDEGESNGASEENGQSPEFTGGMFSSGDDSDNSQSNDCNVTENAIEDFDGEKPKGSKDGQSSTDASGGGSGSIEDVMKEVEAAAKECRDNTFEQVENTNALNKKRDTAKSTKTKGGKGEAIEANEKTMRDICDFREYSRSYKLTDNLPTVLQQRGKIFQRKCDRFLRSRSTPNRTRLNSGSIDASLITGLAYGDTEIFKKKGVDKKFDGAVYMLIDNSGSMSGEKRKKACAAASIIEEGFSKFMPLKIVAFDEYDLIMHEKIKDWEETSKRSMSWNFYLHGREGCGNEDGYDIQIATRELLSRPEDKKLLVVLSDGAPGNCRLVNKAVKDARKKGIKVCAIYFEENMDCYENPRFASMYEKDYIVCPHTEIDKNLEKIVKKFSESA